MLAQIIRILLAVVFYLGGGVFHLVMLLSGRLELYHAFADLALVAVYKTVWETLVVPALPWIVLPVVASLWIIGLIMLGKVRQARFGQMAGVLWNLFLAPFGPWGWTNLVLAFLHGWLYRKEFNYQAWNWSRARA